VNARAPTSDDVAMADVSEATAVQRMIARREGTAGRNDFLINTTRASLRDRTIAKNDDRGRASPWWK